jgi:hypothetical protein
VWKVQSITIKGKECLNISGCFEIMERREKES